jgi:hypothetical protein
VTKTLLSVKDNPPLLIEYSDAARGRNKFKDKFIKN